MQPENLKVYLGSEGETVEWKRSVGEWKEIVVAAAALASLRGGVICIGVEPTGEVSGVQIGKGTLEDLANKIAQNTSPRLVPSISSVKHDDKTVVIASIKESVGKPVYAFDRPYRRAGKTNQRLSQEEALNQFMVSRAMTWDQWVVSEATVMEDIDPALVRRFLNMARTERRWEVRDDTPVDQVLRQLGLLRDGKPTVAAILLFGRNPQRLLTQAMVRCARFKGVTEVHFLDMKVVQGSIIEQVEEAMAFAKRNIRMAAEIRELSRQERWEYPLGALREAIVNAICHRDYASTANVQIRIFDDRLEVWNPGELPEGMTVEDLRREHESKPRNKLVANAFFLIKYVEQFGTGIRRILDDCRTQQLPEPDFQVKGHSFCATFRPGNIVVAPRKDVQLDRRQRNAIEHLKREGRISRRQYAKMTGVSDETAKRDLAKLVEDGILNVHRAGRSTFYTLIGS